MLGQQSRDRNVAKNVQPVGSAPTPNPALAPYLCSAVYAEGNFPDAPDGTVVEEGFPGTPSLRAQSGNLKKPLVKQPFKPATQLLTT